MDVETQKKLAQEREAAMKKLAALEAQEAALKAKAEEEVRLSLPLGAAPHCQ